METLIAIGVLGLLGWAALSKWRSRTGEVSPKLERRSRRDGNSQRLDDSRIVRIDAPRPQGLPRIVLGDVKVAGTSRRQKELVRYAYGTGQAIELEPEPNNEFDSNAIKVVGCWTDLSGKNCREQLGYVPKEMAAVIAHDLSGSRIAATPEVVFLPEGDKSGGLRINIWGPRRQRSKVASKAQDI
ncbi:MAG: HIRAN domain-containing protein [Acidobacteria bacterium]|nr:HIRAN domain-containing protein [Acidobacteriota bacterium]